MQVGLRGAHGIKIASPDPRERDGLSRPETPSFGTAPLFGRSSSPCVSCDAVRVVHPSLAPRFACARARQEMFDAEVCNLISDARARTDVRARCPFPAPACLPVRVERLCPCERPTRESHVILRRRPGHALRHADIPLRVQSRFETAPALASSPTRPCHRASAPSFPGALRTSTELVTPPHRAARFRVFQARSRTTRHDFMTSDVSRGLRDEGPVRAHSSREWNAAGAPPRGGPEHPLSLPRVRVRLEGHARLGDANPEQPRPSFSPPPAKEDAFPKVRVLGTAP